MQLSETTKVGGSGMLALVATYGIGRQAYGLFVPAFREEFGLSVETIGVYASIAQAGYLVATIAAGVLTAKYGPRLPVVAGCVLLTLGAIGTALAGSPLLLAAGITVAGISAGGTWGPFSDAVEQQVPASGRRRALALVNDGSPVGLVVASIFVLAVGGAWRVAWWAFAVVGVLAAVAAWRTLASGAESGSAERRVMPQWRWFVTRRTVRMFTVTIAAALTSGAYFAYAPDTAIEAGLPTWVGPAMWAVLGIAGGVTGAFGGDIADRFGLRGPMIVTLALLAAANGAFVFLPQLFAAAITSSALFGIGFTLVFAILVIWSQQLYFDAPTTGFTVTIVVAALGMVIGPALFGAVAGATDRATALLAFSVPPLLATVIRPETPDEDRTEGPVEGSRDVRSAQLAADGDKA